MKTPIDERLRREAREHAFRFRCQDCAHFDPDHGRCADGYPNAMHRDVQLERATFLEFCKSFELG
jgi:hypothetical protein